MSEAINQENSLTIMNNQPQVFFENKVSNSKTHPKVIQAASQLEVSYLTPKPVFVSDILKTSVVVVVKVFFFPLTLLHLCIERIAANAGLGSDKDARLVFEDKRKKLRELPHAEEIKFSYEGGNILEGMLFGFNEKVEDPNQKTILLCTGSHRSFEYFAIPIVKALRSMGHRVMVFNYEGFGLSEGSRSEAGVYRSVDAAYHYLLEVKKCPPESLLGWGYSLGSAAVANLATNHEIDVILDRGIDDMSIVASETVNKLFSITTGSMVGSILGFLTKIAFVVSVRFDNLSKMGSVQGRVLIAQETENSHRGYRLKKALEDAGKSEGIDFVHIDDVMSSHLHTDHYIWLSDEEANTANKAILAEFISNE